MRVRKPRDADLVCTVAAVATMILLIAFGFSLGIVLNGSAHPVVTWITVMLWTVGLLVAATAGATAYFDADIVEVCPECGGVGTWRGDVCHREACRTDWEDRETYRIYREL